MNKIVGVSVITILILILGFIFFSNKQPAPKPATSFENNAPITNIKPSPTPNTNIKASFAIFTNGTFRVFTASMYHNLSEDVYIESSNPNIVNVKKAGVTWNDFFSTLPFALTPECLTTGTNETFCTGNNGTLKFYINGEQRNNVLDQKINEGDKLLVTFGNESDEAIKRQFSKVP